jgi:hypothetical protein
LRSSDEIEVMADLMEEARGKKGRQINSDQEISKEL